MEGNKQQTVQDMHCCTVIAVVVYAIIYAIGFFLFLGGLLYRNGIDVTDTWIGDVLRALRDILAGIGLLWTVAFAAACAYQGYTAVKGRILKGRS